LYFNPLVFLYIPISTINNHIGSMVKTRSGLVLYRTPHTYTEFPRKMISFMFAIPICLFQKATNNKMILIKLLLIRKDSAIPNLIKIKK